MYDEIVGNNRYQINNNVIIFSFADFKFESLANRNYLKFEQKIRTTEQSYRVLFIHFNTKSPWISVLFLVKHAKYRLAILRTFSFVSIIF